MSRNGNGCIVNIASIGGMKGISVIPAYAVAKSGIIALTRPVAIHSREQGYRIRVHRSVKGED